MAKVFTHVLTSRASRCASASASTSMKLGPPVLTHGTSNQHACSAERPSMVEMQRPKGCCVELGNWSIENQLGSTNSKGLHVLFQGSHQGLLPNDHCLLQVPSTQQLSIVVCHDVHDGAKSGVLHHPVSTHEAAFRAPSQPASIMPPMHQPFPVSPMVDPHSKPEPTLQNSP